jgi:hypothetical protein
MHSTRRNMAVGFSLAIAETKRIEEQHALCYAVLRPVLLEYELVALVKRLDLIIPFGSGQPVTGMVWPLPTKDLLGIAHDGLDYFERMVLADCNRQIERINQNNCTEEPWRTAKLIDNACPTLTASTCRACGIMPDPYSGKCQCT